VGGGEKKGDHIRYFIVDRKVKSITFSFKEKKMKRVLLPTDVGGEGEKETKEGARTFFPSQ